MENSDKMYFSVRAKPKILSLSPHPPKNMLNPLSQQQYKSFVTYLKESQIFCFRAPVIERKKVEKMYKNVLN